MRKPFLALCIVVVLIALGCVMWLSPRRPVDQSRASTAEASPRTTVSLQERVEPPMVAGGLQTGSGGQVRKWCEKHLRMSGVVWLTEGR